MASGRGRARVVGVDAVAADGVFDFLRLALAGLAQPVQRGDHDVGSVGLEMAAQRRAGVATAKAVGAERYEGPGAQRAIWSGTAFI